MAEHLFFSFAPLELSAARLRGFVDKGLQTSLAFPYDICLLEKESGVFHVRCLHREKYLDFSNR